MALGSDTADSDSFLTCSRFFKNFLKFIYLFERDRDRVSGEGAAREGEKENPKQTAHFQHRA